MVFVIPVTIAMEERLCRTPQMALLEMYAQLEVFVSTGPRK